LYSYEKTRALKMSIQPHARLGRRRLVFEGCDLDGDAKCLMAAVAAVGERLQAGAAALEIFARHDLRQLASEAAQLHRTLEPSLLAVFLGRPQHEQVGPFGDQEGLAAAEVPA